MEKLRCDCLNHDKCIQTRVYGMLANIGGRVMQMPDCEYCNVYTPEDKEVWSDVQKDISALG